MKNKRITDSWNKIEPDYYADRRMFSNILEESRNQGRTENTMNKLSSLPKAAKGLLVAIAVLAVMVVTMSVINNRAARQQQATAEAGDPSTGTAVPAGENGTNTPSGGNGAAAVPSDENTDTQQWENEQGETVTVSAGSLGTPGSVTVGDVTVTALPRPVFLTADALTETAAAAETRTASVPAYSIDPNLGNIINANSPYIYLTDEEKELLVQNGFVASVGSAGEEFYTVYESNRYSLVPNFVTVDSMMHTYHLYFSHLMKNTERNYLSENLRVLSAAMTERCAAQYEAVKGTEWEEAAKASTAFFAVGTSLLDPSFTAPSYVSDIVGTELSNITTAGGLAESPLMRMIEVEDSPCLEDYSQYIVRGYYEGDPVLEPYFRAMMWFGRINFPAKSENANRTALLITLALDDVTKPVFESIYEITSFFAGASDDCGYYEYRPIIDSAYGADVTAASLPGNDAAFTQFCALALEMPAPKINSVVVMDTGTETDHEAENKGFRYMGQRFTVDATIMQNLVYNKVDDRKMPNALDVPAALGSDAALKILEEKGETSYGRYMDNMNKLRTELSGENASLWNASLYSQWLNTIRPLLSEYGEGYPLFMQNYAWQAKNLQTFLGSYAELKHDTVLYAKQMMVEMGGGEPPQTDDRGYVEPEPEVFSRLALLTKATADGLAGYNLLGSEDAGNLELLRELAEKLAVIAEKELRNELPTDEEFELIRTFGGQLEHFWYEVYKYEDDDGRFTSRDFPAAIITDIATNADTGNVLEVGTGRVSEIYVIVPVDGVLRIATGGIYSFYQFEHPMSDRLTDTKWRQMMGIELTGDNYAQENAKQVEEWTHVFQLNRTYY